MIDIELKADVKEVAKKIKNLQKISETAMKRAIKRAVTRMKKEASKSVREEYSVKSGAVKEGFDTEKENGLITVLYSRGTPISLSKFRMSPSSHSEHAERVRISVKKGRSSILKHAFVRTFGSGVPGAFERINKDQYPFRESMGPSVPQMLGGDRVILHLKEIGQEVVQERFAHELEYLMGKN